MKPGNELNAKIAKDVFGQKFRRIDNSDKYIHEEFGYELKPYSTDIAAAWEVGEKVYDWEFAVHAFRVKRPEGLSNDYWEASFWSRKKNEMVTAEGETAPHAICLAALKAVGK